MSSEHRSEQDKDKLLLNAFRDLETRGIKSDLAKSATPYTQLHIECENVMCNKSFAKAVDEYLRVRTILRRSMEMFFTYIAMFARANWKNVSPEIRPITARGWFLGRWIPTFLILDGPIGRFLYHCESPLSGKLPVVAPMLDAARVFYEIRNFIHCEMVSHIGDSTGK